MSVNFSKTRSSVCNPFEWIAFNCHNRSDCSKKMIIFFFSLNDGPGSFLFALSSVFTCVIQYFYFTIVVPCIMLRCVCRSNSEKKSAHEPHTCLYSHFFLSHGEGESKISVYGFTFDLICVRDATKETIFCISYRCHHSSYVQFPEWIADDGQ